MRRLTRSGAFAYTRTVTAGPSQDERRDLATLVERYGRLIRSAVRRVAGGAGEAIADDVEQRVLLALWKAMPGEQTPSHPSSYLYRAAVRETVRVLREEARFGHADTAEAGDVRDPRPDPDETARSRELATAIDAALQTLTEHRRRAVRAHLAGFDVQEIMMMCDWSYNTARNRISRGMIDLRRELERRGIRG